MAVLPAYTGDDAVSASVLSCFLSLADAMLTRCSRLLLEYNIRDVMPSTAFNYLALFIGD